MSSLHDTAVIKIEDPGPAQISPRLRRGFALAAGVGIVFTALGLFLEPHRAWNGYLVNYLYFLILGMAGLFLTALHYAAGATWSIPFRRIAESLTRYLPIAALSTVVLVFGFKDIYPWAAGTVHFHRATKTAWFGYGFTAGRLIVFSVLWALCGWIFVRRSLNQDAAWRRGAATNWEPRRVPGGFGKIPSFNGRFSAAFLLFFAITFSLAAIDWLMSLEPNWNTTMYAVYIFAGLFEAGLALVLLISVLLRRRGSMGQILRDHHYVDLARMLHAFSIFMVYIGFEQYLLIWYANYPSEAIYYHQRIVGGWGYVLLFLLFAKWVIPFTVLLNQKIRKNEKALIAIASLVLFAEWVDLYWLVMPVTHAHFVLPNWAVIAELLAFLGLFGWAVTSFLARNSPVPVGDPRLVNAVAGDYL